MEFGGLKRGFLATDRSKGKEDKSKESGSSSDHSIIDISRTLAKANDAKKLDVAPAEHSQDKAQTRDVASSSDVNKIGDIPENFKLIGGNTDLANAKVILLGEVHIPQHRKGILNFINTHAKDGDIVLIESVKAYEPITKVQFTEFTQNTIGKEDYPELTKNIKIYGWDDEKASESGSSFIVDDFLSVRRLCRMFFDGRENSTKKEELYKKIDKYKENISESRNTRNEKMLEVINNMRNEGHNRKIFVIAGSNHFTTESIVSTKENLESVIKENLGDAKDLNSLIIKTLTSIALKRILPPEEKHLTSLIQENFKNQPYIVLERDCVLGLGSSLEKVVEDRLRRVYYLGP